MTIRLLHKIRSGGGSVRLEGGSLRISAPSGLLDQGDREELSARKTDLVRLLSHEAVREVLDRLAPRFPHGYQMGPDRDQWDALERPIDRALLSGEPVSEALEQYERGALALFTKGQHA